jgi:hypothetical protein
MAELAGLNLFPRTTLPPADLKSSLEEVATDIGEQQKTLNKAGKNGEEATRESFDEMIKTAGLVAVLAASHPTAVGDSLAIEAVALGGFAGGMHVSTLAHVPLPPGAGDRYYGKMIKTIGQATAELDYVIEHGVDQPDAQPTHAAKGELSSWWTQ